MRRSFGFIFVILSALAVPLFSSGAVVAQAPVSADAKQQARDRFDRGLKLFDQADNAGALAEFKRAYELVPSPLVLFNIGLVYVAMNRPVDALDAFEKVLANPKDLTTDDIAKAVKTRADLATRVATVKLVTDAAGAVVDVDGVRAGKIPLESPLRVTGGTHTIAVTAPGFAPFRKEVTVAGGETRDVVVEMVAVDQNATRLRVLTHLPDAEVFVGGESKGKTPLTAPLTVSPGARHVELKRPGYRTATVDVTVASGATADVTLEPEVEYATLAAEGEIVRLNVSEPGATVSADGKPAQDVSRELKLLPGRHLLRVERGGFLPVERTITVERGVQSTVRIDLEITADARAEVMAKARTRRTWGWITVAGGAAIAGGGGVFLYANSKSIDDARAKYDDIVAQSVPGSRGRCDKLQPLTPFADCDAELTTRYDNLQNAKSLTKVGYILMGAGAAVAATGVILLLTGEDVSRYERTRGDAAAKGPTVLPIVSVGHGEGSFAVIGTF